MSSMRRLTQGTLGLAAVAVLSLSGLPLASATPVSAPSSGDSFSGTTSFQEPLTAGPFRNPIPQARIVVTLTENTLPTRVSAVLCDTGGTIGTAFIAGNDHTSTIIGGGAGSTACFNLRIQSDIPQAPSFRVSGNVDYR